MNQKYIEFSIIIMNGRMTGILNNLSNLQNMNIAIVEDEVMYIDSYREMIMSVEPRWNIDAYLNSSKKTITNLLTNDYDLILLDIILGEDVTGGFRILGKLLEYFGGKGPGVIVLTGAVHPRDVPIMRSFSVNDVSDKPETTNELMDKINLFRRSKEAPASFFGDLEFRPFTAFRNVLRNENAASLTQQEIGILHALVSSEGRPVRITELINKRLGVSEDSIKKAISEIRAKLSFLYPELKITDILVTNIGLGYSWHGLKA